MAATPVRTHASWPITLIASLFAISILVMLLNDDGDATESSDQEKSPAAAVVDLKTLPASNTHTMIKAAPKDKRPSKVPKGTVVHPKRTVPLYDKPDGKPFAKIGARQFGDTWLPVITRNSQWVQVLLPSKPNGSTGWIRSSEVAEAHSRFLIKVHLGSRTIEIFDNNSSVGSWPVAIGATSTPTPTGRTFVVGQISDEKQPFSPVILPLGSHSATLDSYGGGPGTVALHGWTDPEVFGKAISHGCVRVPDEALARLRTIPTGSPVMIDSV